MAKSGAYRVAVGTDQLALRYLAENELPTPVTNQVSE